MTVAVVLLVAAPAVACMWDYDTLRDERRGLPGVAEVLAGQWERHSPFFYEHRVAAMRAKLATRPDDWDAVDNLAVALEKLDRRDEAVAVLLDKDRRHPGQYTTAANLGTVYIHQGKLAEGIAQLKRALAINPDAHFGREEYQLELAEFLRGTRVAPKLRDDDFLGLRGGHRVGPRVESPGTRPTSTTEPAVADYVDYRPDFLYVRDAGDLSHLGLKSNVLDGLVGMVRFGTGTSPDLYFALGDVLAARGDKNLAVRAYRRALELHYPRPDVVRHALDTVTEMQVDQSGLSDAAVAAERAAAERWVADYQRFEDELIRAGRDTDDEANYAAFYATHSRSLPAVRWTVAELRHRYGDYAVVSAGVVAVVGVVVAREVYRARRRRRSTGPA